MAYSIEQWQKAQTLFEAGLSLSKIAEKTGIDKSSISKKAKIQLC
jgi:transcriptional regulator with XRE-family HTH domain